ncbi:U-box domain-containing protein 28-like [Impatiens glandulifera]|uniref:U-box domain-containing protein 28-like n=1 Tax=Impatiens glandulifera TaxID=253017 RepID=UPI001FB11484|nr:U-box domain-containing protein 28-like [Impatiens glandulifera]
MKKMKGKKSNLYVTIPAPFRCPISMDVMKSPVSLCTGVTYDRSSIQTWLETGHNTCPVTMQVLQSTDIIPNLNLRNLIRHFSDTLLRLSPDSTPCSSQLISKQQVTYSIRNIETGNSEFRLNNLSAISDFARFSDQNREFLAVKCDLVSALVRILKKNVKEIEILETVIEILALIIIEVGVDKVNKLVNDCLSSFLIVLRRGKTSSKIASARVLESISLDSESQSSIGLLQVLYCLLIETDDQITKQAVLSCLIAISKSRKTVKHDLIQKGIAKTAGDILWSSITTAPVIEQIMKLLEMVSSCTEGRSAIGEDEKCVSGVVKRIMTKSTSGEATENGVAVLWSVCYMSRNATAMAVAMKSNAVAKVLMVMQSGCSGGGMYQMCKDLIKVLRVNSKSCLASYDTKVTHIMPY